MSKLIAIEDVKPGMVIVHITQQNGPVKIRKSGLVTSDAMVQGLAEMGVQEVEIDPEQTVEIASQTSQHHTQTQALLRGHHDTSAQLDNSLNEQFHRSLFLPTVESLPSGWKRHSKRVGVYAFVVGVGLTIGFMSATTERWWPLATEFSSNDMAVEPIETASQDKALVEASAPSLNSERDDGTTDINTLEPPVSEGDVESGRQQVASEQSPLEQQVNEVPAHQQAVAQNSELNTKLDNNEYEGKVLNETQDTANVSVSPELMAKFNEAVKALDSQVLEEPALTNDEVVVHNDVPRVDQLPVRLLTRLPSMNFSAHMYASRPADRWVRVNGRQMTEGDWIDDRVQIINIEAQRVVLQFEGELFSMAALTDW